MTLDAKGEGNLVTRLVGHLLVAAGGLMALLGGTCATLISVVWMSDKGAGRRPTFTDAPTVLEGAIPVLAFGLLLLWLGRRMTQGPKWHDPGKPSEGPAGRRQRFKRLVIDKLYPPLPGRWGREAFYNGVSTMALAALMTAALGLEHHAVAVWIGVAGAVVAASAWLRAWWILRRNRREP